MRIDYERLELKQAKWIAFWVLLIAVALTLLFGCSEQKYENAKFVIEEKGDYNGKYFLLRMLESDTLKVPNNNIMIIINRVDTIYTVFNEQNFMYNKHIKWDQFYFSYNLHDTLLLTINKNKCWRKIKK